MWSDIVKETRASGENNQPWIRDHYPATCRHAEPKPLPQQKKTGVYFCAINAPFISESLPIRWIHACNMCSFGVGTKTSSIYKRMCNRYGDRQVIQTKKQFLTYIETTGQLRYVKLAYLGKTTYVEVMFHSWTFPPYALLYFDLVCVELIYHETSAITKWFSFP